MVKKVTAKAKGSTKKKKAAGKSSARDAFAKGTVKSKRIQTVKRVARKVVPKKKVSILVLVVLAMASVVTVAWLFDIV